MLAPWKKSHGKPRQRIKKQRHHFADKVLYSQSYGFSSSEVVQSCPILCDHMDCSLPGSSVHGIFLAIVLEWIAIAFSRGSSQPRDLAWVSFATPRTVAYQAPLSMGFSRQEYWSELPFPSPMHAFMLSRISCV